MNTLTWRELAQVEYGTKLQFVTEIVTGSHVVDHIKIEVGTVVEVTDNALLDGEAKLTMMPCARSLREQFADTYGEFDIGLPLESYDGDIEDPRWDEPSPLAHFIDKDLCAYHIVCAFQHFAGKSMKVLEAVEDLDVETLATLNNALRDIASNLRTGRARHHDDSIKLADQIERALQHLPFVKA